MQFTECDVYRYPQVLRTCTGSTVRIKGGIGSCIQRGRDTRTVGESCSMLIYKEVYKDVSSCICDVVMWVNTTFCCVQKRQSEIKIAFHFHFHIVFVLKPSNGSNTILHCLQVFDVIASFGMHVCGSNIKQQPKKTNHTATNAS